MHSHSATQMDLNPSIALFGACKILLHKLRLEARHKTLVGQLTECQEVERAARRTRFAALDDVKRAEEALEQAKRALEKAKKVAKELEEPLEQAVTATDKVRRELTMVNAEIKERDADFDKEEQMLSRTYEVVVALSQEAMMQAQQPLHPSAVPTNAMYPNLKPFTHHSLASPPSTPAAPVKQEEKTDDPKKPTPEERSDSFIATLNELQEQLPGEVYIDGRTYFFVGDLTRIFSPDLKDPNKSGSAHARKYGTIDGGEYRQGVRKQAGRWIMTLEAFEAYVKPHLRDVQFIKY